MINDLQAFTAFLLRAKRATYAGHGTQAQPSRPAAHDLPYQEGNYFYLDSYLGGLEFIGEEAVWEANVPLWGMNYAGWMLVAEDEIPAEFGEFLKAALRECSPQAPYRGPTQWQAGAFSYECQWQGSLERFEGREAIHHHGQKIYQLVFHGGKIR